MRPLLLTALLLFPLAACGGGTGTGRGQSALPVTATSTMAQATATVAPATAAPPAATASPPTATLTPGGGTIIPVRPGGLPSTSLSLADDGKTYHYHVGDTFGLALRAPDGFQNWEVTAPDPRILAPAVNPAAAAARGVTLRAFRAVGAGQAELTASSRPACQAGQGCPALVRAFKVTVVVDG